MQYILVHGCVMNVCCHLGQLSRVPSLQGSSGGLLCLQTTRSFAWAFGILFEDRKCLMRARIVLCHQTRSINLNEISTTPTTVGLSYRLALIPFPCGAVGSCTHPITPPRRGTIYLKAASDGDLSFILRLPHSGGPFRLFCLLDKEFVGSWIASRDSLVFSGIFISVGG